MWMSLSCPPLLPPDSVACCARSPDLTTGWAVHFIQEHKLLLPAAVLPRAEAVVAAREAAGASYNEAAEEVWHCRLRSCAK